jgi:hypothetical protein
MAKFVTVELPKLIQAADVPIVMIEAYTILSQLLIKLLRTSLVNLSSVIPWGDTVLSPFT